MRQSLRRLAIGAIAIGGVLAAVSALDGLDDRDPCTSSTRFARVRTAAPAVSTTIDVTGASWRTTNSEVDLVRALFTRGQAPVGGLLAAAIMVAPQVVTPQEPVPVPISVKAESTSTHAAAQCSVAPHEVETGASHSSPCTPPGPSSAYAGNENPDMTKCSAVVSEAASSTQSGSTCSTQGITQDGEEFGGKGACSAHGADPSRKMDDTEMSNCSTSGGSGEGGAGATTTCSAQQGENTVGGGCSAGSLQKDDERNNVSCSVNAGSEGGSVCSISGDTTSTEMDCSAGNNPEGKSSECSIYTSGAGGGEGSFCSVKSDGGSTTGSCSAWNMENPKGSGESGDVKCSVLGGGEGKCSVQGSSGGNTHPDGGVDGFCSAGPGGDNQKPGGGSAECSVIPAGGPGACSAFKPDGTPHPGQPDKQGNCFLPRS